MSQVWCLYMHPGATMSCRYISVWFLLSNRQGRYSSVSDPLCCVDCETGLRQAMPIAWACAQCTVMMFDGYRPFVSSLLTHAVLCPMECPPVLQRNRALL